jgi:low temperature requirement protein LtrA
MSSVRHVPWRLPMTGRDPGEQHRASTPLELFFDLCFVVAVASAAAELHHGLAEGHFDAVAGFALSFFAIWWAWMNYTWFASAYDTGDVRFRLLTFVVMSGALVFAAGLPTLFERGNSAVAVLGYAIMRLGMVPLWLRAARDHAQCRRTALWYAVGISIVQLLWIARLWVPGPALGAATACLLVALELAVPWLAERHGMTPWHREHIAERYSLFTIIVLGEVLLATTQGIQGTLEEHGFGGPLLMTIVGGLLIVFGMWWVYFKHPGEETLASGSSFVFGYGHYVVFASVAAVGAALAAAVDVVQHEAHVGQRAAGLALAIAVAVYLLALGAVHARAGRADVLAAPAVTSALVLVVAAFGVGLGLTVLLIGLVVAGAVAHYLLATHRAVASPRAAERP